MSAVAMATMGKFEYVVDVGGGSGLGGGGIGDEKKPQVVAKFSESERIDCKVDEVFSIDKIEEETLSKKEFKITEIEEEKL